MNSYETVFLPFGKYKDLSFDLILKKDPGYLEWLRDTPAMPIKYRTIAERVLKGEDVSEYATTSKTIKVTEKPLVWLKTRRKTVACIEFSYNKNILERFKHEIDGRKWNAEERHWEFPIAQMPNLIKIFGSKDNIDFDESAKKAFEKEIKHKKEVREISTLQDIELEIPLNIDLFNIQRVAVKFAERANGRVIIADDPGLGKTISSIAFAIYKKAKTLVVVPKSVVPGWIRELKRVAGKEFCVWDTKETYGHKNLQFHIINYEAVSKRIDELKNIGFDLLICDEASKHIRNRKTQKATSLLGNGKSKKGLKTKYVLLLTGTPVMNRPSELFSLVNFLDKERFPNFFHFVQKYGGWRGDAPKNLLDLHDRIKDVVIRRTRKEAFPDFPDKTRFDIVVDMSKAEREKYDSLLKEVFSKWKVNGKPGVAELPPLQQFLNTVKMPRLTEIIDNYIDIGKPILVFSNYLEPLKKLQQQYSEVAVMLHGQHTTNQRDDIIQKLSTGSALLGLFSIGAGAEGIDGLQNRIDTAIFLDQAWVPVTHEQAESRVHRKGQENKVQIYYMTVQNTIDDYMRKLLSDKQKVIDEIVDGRPITIERDKSFFKEFVTLLRAQYAEEF